jgi:signal peptidase II
MQKMPEGSSSKRLALNFLIVCFIVLCDQLSKFVVVRSLELGEILHPLPFLNIVRIENEGITFGLLGGILHPFTLISISLAIIISLCLWMIGKNRRHQLTISLIVGGAIGNLIDRFIHKGVIDFLDFHVLTYHWPAFNVADSVIVIGVLVLFFISGGDEEKEGEGET